MQKGLFDITKGKKSNKTYFPKISQVNVSFHIQCSKTHKKTKSFLKQMTSILFTDI